LLGEAKYPPEKEDEGLMRENKSDLSSQRDDISHTEQATLLLRKVAASGHISYDGRPYFVSKHLAGKYIRVCVYPDRLVITSEIPLHKEFSTGGGAQYTFGDEMSD
jgi:hypothetical protein